MILIISAQMHACMHYFFNFSMPSLVHVIRHSLLSLQSLPPATFETHKEAPASCFLFPFFFSNFHCSIVVHLCLVCSASFFYSKSIFIQSVQRELCFFSYFIILSTLLLFITTSLYTKTNYILFFYIIL